ncbi:MAG: DUF1385 domain-containing protein [Anaerolineales bacterium]|nr:DUF1385 domain-containing protein [Anaerolineales bacterium]
MNKQQQEQPLYGGQAVIEGVMMRGANAFSVAVRDPNNEIVIHTEPLNKNIYDSWVSRTPFTRGLTMLWDALGLGMKALMFSAEVAEEPEEDTQTAASEPADPKTRRDPSDIFKEPAMIGTVLFSIGLSVGLFLVLPSIIAGLIVSSEEANLLSNLIEGVVRLILVIGYVGGIGLLPDIQRVYQYHGAEHKTINAYEAGAELTPVSVAKYPLEHPRCGTGFLLTVVILSILLFSFFPPMSMLVRALSRILLVPVIAGIAYEFLRFTAKHQDKMVVRAITKPNLALQKLTTREPNLEMLEVAIAAFNEVRSIDLEKAAASEPIPAPAAD